MAVLCGTPWLSKAGHWVQGTLLRLGTAISGGAGSEQPLTFPTPQPPSEDKINGILLGFRLRYRELLYDTLRGFTLHSIGNPSTTWAELTRECLWPREAQGHVGHSGGGQGTAGQCPASHALHQCSVLGTILEPSCDLRSCHLCAIKSDFAVCHQVRLSLSHCAVLCG